MSRGGGARIVLVLALAGAIALAPAGRAQEPDPGGGADISATVPSVLEMSLQRAGANTISAQVTSSVPRTALSVASPAASGGGSLSVDTGATQPRRLRAGSELVLANWQRAVTDARVVLQLRATPSGTQSGAVLVVTAAPETP